MRRCGAEGSGAEEQRHGLGRQKLPEAVSYPLPLSPAAPQPANQNFNDSR